MKKIIVVFNPAAGSNDKAKIKEQIDDYFKTQPCTLTWYLTCGSDDISKVKDEVKKAKPDLLIAAGGDGTCNLVAHAAIESKVALAIIPAGSANALAKELNIPIDIPKALDIAQNGKVISIDYLKVNDHLCIRQAEIGVNAQLIKSFETAQKRGMTRYVSHFFQNLFNWKTFSASIKTVSGVLKKRRVVSLTFASSRKYGTGAVINPTGEIDDGLFEIVVIHSFPLYSLPSLFIRFFTGKIHESIYSDVISCRQAQVDLRKKRLLQVDGELIGKTDHINITAYTKALNIVVPE